MPWTGVLTIYYVVRTCSTNSMGTHYGTEPINAQLREGVITDADEWGTHWSAHRFGRYLCPSSCSIHLVCLTLRSADQIPDLGLLVMSSASSYYGHSDGPLRPSLTRKRRDVIFFFRTKVVVKTEALIQLHYKLNKPPKNKPFTVSEPISPLSGSSARVTHL